MRRRIPPKQHSHNDVPIHPITARGRLTVIYEGEHRFPAHHLPGVVTWVVQQGTKDARAHGAKVPLHLALRREESIGILA
jgi:hypothetical protein